MTIEQAQRLSEIQADIANRRAAYRNVSEELLQLMRDVAEAQRGIEFVNLVKQDIRRELARLRKQKSRLLTGRN